MAQTHLCPARWRLRGRHSLEQVGLQQWRSSCLMRNPALLAWHHWPYSGSSNKPRTELQRGLHRRPDADSPAGLQVHMRTGTSSPFTSSCLPPVSSTTTGRLLEKPSAASCWQQSPPPGAVAGAVTAAGVAPPAGSVAGDGACSSCLALPAEAQGASSRQERARRQRGRRMAVGRDAACPTGPCWLAAGDTEGAIHESWAREQSFAAEHSLHGQFGPSDSGHCHLARHESPHLYMYLYATLRVASSSASLSELIATRNSRLAGSWPDISRGQHLQVSWPLPAVPPACSGRCAVTDRPYGGQRAPPTAGCRGGDGRWRPVQAGASGGNRGDAPQACTLPG